jgi:hypothetical protein
MAVVIVRNLKDLLVGFDKLEKNVEVAAEHAIAMAGLAIERQAKVNASGRPGPNVRTGDLRRNIRTEVRYGFGTYLATVGAYMEYSRAVELGSPLWKSGVKYPYLGPAAETLKNNGTLTRVFSVAFAKKMKG